MSPQEALNYYTPYEVCKLYRLEERSDLIKCNELGASKAHMPPTCLLEDEGLGSTPVICGHNDGAKLRYTSTQPFPESYNFRTVVNHMRRRGMNTIIMIGDSITSQHVADAFCSAYRHGYNDLQFIDVSKFPIETIRKPSFIIPFNANNAGGATPTDDKPYFQVYHFLLERLHTTGAPGEERRMNPMSSSYFTQMKKVIDEILASSSTNPNKAMFIVNAGLHDQVPEYYIFTIHLVMKFFLSEYGSKEDQSHVIFFRETSTQHFKTVTGEFPWNDKSFSWSITDEVRQSVRNEMASLVSDQLIVSKHATTVGNDGDTKQAIDHRIRKNHETLLHALEDSYNCQHSNQIEDQNWKNKIMHDKLKELDPTGNILHLLPFWNITVGRYDAHSRYKKDCSHYCNNPMIFLPLWDSIVKEGLLRKRF